MFNVYPIKMYRKKKETKKINFLVLLLLKIILIFSSFNSYGKIFEGNGFICSEEETINNDSLFGLAYCEENNNKWFSHVKNNKFNGYTLQLFNTGAMLISYLEDGSMNSLGYYQKENYVEISEHKKAKRNGLGLKIYDIEDPSELSRTYLFKNNEVDTSYPVKEAYYDQKNDRLVQKLYYVDDQLNYSDKSFYFEITKSTLNNDYRVSYITQINELGIFDGYGVRIINGSDITYGIFKKGEFIKTFEESELTDFPLEFWDFQTTLTQYNKSFLTFTNDINRFLKEASNSLSIFIDANEWDFLSQRDLDSLKKKYEVQIKELNDFKN